MIEKKLKAGAGGGTEAAQYIALEQLELELELKLELDQTPK
jgi:hypothetical protein